MKTVVWVVFAVLALLWTGCAAALAALAQWTADGLAAGASVDLARLADGWVLPGWMAPWISAEWVALLQDLTASAVTGLREGAPWLGSLVGWLVPLVWLTWGLGLLALLVLAGVGHGLARLMGKPTRPAAAA